METVSFDFLGYAAELRSDVPEVVAYGRALFARFVSAHAGAPRYRLEIESRADGSWSVRDPWIRDAVVRDGQWLPGIVAARLLEAASNGVERHYLLHAAAVARGDDGLIVAGESGFGKSTLAMGLAGRGWRLLSDEVAVVDANQARIVRAGKGGAPEVTDGPFAEAKEFLAGYWIVQVDTPEQAYAIAARASAAPGQGGKPMNMAIEVREVPSGPPADL